MIKTIMVIAALVLVSACASMSKNECLNADWNMIGFEDGSNGSALSRVGLHRKACAKVNVTPNMDAYETGHKKGARQFCTVGKGYAEGARGATYHGICPADLAPEFIQAYEDGLALFEMNNIRRDMDATISSLQQRIVNIEADIAFHEDEIIKPGSRSHERSEHLATIRDLQNEISAVQIDLMNAQDDRHAFDNDYQNLLREHKRLGY